MTPTSKQTTATKAPQVGEWVVEAQRTKAKVCRSYQRDGEQRFEEETLSGRPQDVKRAAGPKYAGEVTELEYVHTWTTLSREIHENTTNGATKRREQREVQTYDFGDGRRVNTTANPQGYLSSDEEKGGSMDKTDYLKNMHDQLDDRETAHDVSNKADRSTMWVVIVGVAVIATVALMLAIL